MNLYFRLIRILFIGLLRPQLHHSQAIDSKFRVWPHDLDAFGHMNNGRYLQIMDVARAEWMIRTRVAGAIRRNRWTAVLGGGFIRYRHALHFMQSYHVSTRLLCWDRRWFFLEHTFIDHRGRCVAKGISRAALRNRSGWVDTADVVAEVHPGALSPLIPGYVSDWLQLEDEMFRFDSARTHDADSDEFLRKAG